MSNQSHTPEPWQINDDEYGNFVYALNADGTNRFYFSISGGYVSQQGKDSTQWERTSREEIKANALLCIAAPEMLEALKSIENDDGRIPATIWEMRNDAIRKATGKPAPTAPDYYPTKP